MKRYRYTRTFVDGQAYIPSHMVEMTSQGEIIGAPIQELAMFESSGLSPLEVHQMQSKMAAYQMLGTPTEIADQIVYLNPRSGCVDSFRGRYEYLSNFYPCEIEVDGLVFGSVEAAFQAAKCCDPAQKSGFVGLSAKEARKKGRSVAMRSDWESSKLYVMRSLVLQKFMRHRELREMLLATGDALLVEMNRWHDNYWGRCSCPRCQAEEHRNNNNLGRLLMKTRTKLRLQLEPHHIPVDKALTLVVQPRDNGLEVQILSPDGTTRTLLSVRYDCAQEPENRLVAELHRGGHPMKYYFGSLGRED